MIFKKCFDLVLFSNIFFMEIGVCYSRINSTKLTGIINGSRKNELFQNMDLVWIQSIFLVLHPRPIIHQFSCELKTVVQFQIFSRTLQLCDCNYCKQKNSFCQKTYINNQYRIVIYSIQIVYQFHCGFLIFWQHCRQRTVGTTSCDSVTINVKIPVNRNTSEL